MVCKGNETQQRELKSVLMIEQVYQGAIRS